MNEARLRIGWGRMTVVAPGKAAEVQSALLIHDPQAGKVGVQIIQGDLKGYVVLVDRASLDAVASSGKPVDELPSAPQRT